MVVTPRLAACDVVGRAVLDEIRQFGVDSIEGVTRAKVFLLEGSLERAHVERLAASLFHDPVTEIFDLGPGFSSRSDEGSAVEVHPLPGVMNPEALSALDAANRLLDDSGVGVSALQTARRYLFAGAADGDTLDLVAAKVLANDCIETWFVRAGARRDALPESFPVPPERGFEVRQVAIRSLDDAALQRLSREGHLFLSLDEMRAVKAFFRELGRDPTDLELETLAQTWSEHCVHKTLKSAIEYEGQDFTGPGQVRVRFDNLLADTIAAATRTLNRDWCLSVFKDNAGVVAFDEDYGIAFKAETHNHPSAIEPYGGAATGIGGCIRDIMGCGLGARPIASTDVFCVAPPDFDRARLPGQVLHPRRVLRGVVGGVRDYGNRMGIPTVNGAIVFDERYLANPLVFCGCVGLIPRRCVEKAPREGDLVVVAGGRTGRDGIHGATFSSAEMTDTAADEFSHAVQIGNAIEEKKLLDAMLLARDHEGGCLYSAVTDCGAGGLSSAVGEMGERLGVEVDLERVPLKYAGLRYDEIWISEAQERMVFAVPPDHLAAFMAVFAGEEVEATVLGRFTGDGRLRVRYAGSTVGDLPMAFVHDGLPKRTLQARWSPPAASVIAPPPLRSADDLLAALSELNTASKEWVIRQYDHEVQGRSVVKPLAGPGAGPSDAAVIRPRYDRPGAVAIGCGICPHRGDEDPYVMALLAVDEALRNVVCVGADPERVAILDNFCWPKVDTESSLGALVRACRGAHDAAIAYGVPFISGKDSLNNEFVMDAAEAQRTGLPERLAIPPTLLISALGIVDDASRGVTLDFKRSGSAIVLAHAELQPGSLEEAARLHRQVAGMIRDGKVLAAHDVSDGGIAVAVAEMAIASGHGAVLEAAEGEAASWLAELPSAYILEMDEADAASAGWRVLGRVTNTARLEIRDGGRSCCDVSVDDMARAWREPLRQV